MSTDSAAPDRGDGPQDELVDVYGDGADTASSSIQLPSQKTDFLPWHHPVKQIVREMQWAALAGRMLAEGAPASRVLRYFTLPGVDLLDVRTLAEICGPAGVQVEYFGFDESQRPRSPDASKEAPSWIGAESALRQAGRITDRALILSDRLEDIAVDGSQALTQLQQQEPFHIINIDACDHLAYQPDGRATSTFDALRKLLSHQMTARDPWLLFITTRVDPALLGAPVAAFQRAISENLAMQGAPQFADALANAVGAQLHVLPAALNAAWVSQNIGLLKLYTVGLGKYLLQYFHAQPNYPAAVELVSAYSYRVHGEEPDMLALAFRVTPQGQRTFAPSVGGATAIPMLEPERAVRIVERAQRLWDLDDALATQQPLFETAVIGTVKLLREANYDIDAWLEWIKNHKVRPLLVPDALINSAEPASQKEP